MKKITVIFTIISIITIGGWAQAAEPLLDVKWINNNLGKPATVLLDVRDNSAYQKGHIPGAINSEYEGSNWRIKMNGVRGMLPDTKHLLTLIGNLGITNADHVVLISSGYNASEMAVATRIYWTFKVLGHDDVSILDGGMAAYLKNRKNPIEKKQNTPIHKTFTPHLRPGLIASQKDVKKAMNGGNLVDNRSHWQFTGMLQSLTTKRPGTIPGAKNMPIMSLTRNNGGFFLDADATKALYQKADIATKGPTITFCNTGHMASLGWFVLYELMGNKQTRLYDGSMAEWTMDKNNPVVKK